MPSDPPGDRARDLAERRDWAGLWQLARELPVIEAATALRLIDDDWRPPTDAGRSLRSRLAGVSPGALARERAALRPGPCSLHRDAIPTACCFSADGRTLVVASEPRSEPGTGMAGVPWDMRDNGPTQAGFPLWTVLALPDGSEVSRRRRFRFAHTSSLAVADGTVFGVSCRPPHWERQHLLRQEPGDRVRHRERLSGSARLFPSRDGFVLGHHARDGQPRLRRYDQAGNLTSETALPAGEPGDVVRLLAVNPANGHLAVETRVARAGAGRDRVPVVPTPGRLWLLGSDGREVLASSPVQELDINIPASFLAEDRLITTQWGVLTLWGVTGSALEPIATRPEFVDAAPSPTRARIVARALRKEDGGLVRARCHLDPQTLHCDFEIPEPDRNPTQYLWRSPLPAGPLVLGNEEGFTIVPDTAEAAAVADRPPASWVPADLAAVASVAGSSSLPQPGRELLTLLHQWLRYQLGEDAASG